MNASTPSTPSTPPMPARPGSDTVPDTAVQVEQLAVDLPQRGDWLRREQRILTDITLRAPRGMVTALVGANGAGKTTLLRALTGSLRTAAGTIEVLGRPVGGPEHACPPGVGVVPDQPVFPAEWTACDVIALRRRLGDPFDHQLFTAMLRDRGIRQRALISSLSAGQATTFALAAALATAPRLLILDEPLARLDPLARTELLDLLRDWLAADPAHSILLSTHDLEGMERFADHLVVIHEGRTVLEGDVDELLDEHVIVTFASQSAAAPFATRPAGSDGAVEALRPAEESVGLNTVRDLRRPSLQELVSMTLAAHPRTRELR